METGVIRNSKTDDPVRQVSMATTIPWSVSLSLMLEPMCAGFLTGLGKPIVFQRGTNGSTLPTNEMMTCLQKSFANLEISMIPVEMIGCTLRPLVSFQETQEDCAIWSAMFGNGRRHVPTRRTDSLPLGNGLYLAGAPGTPLWAVLGMEIRGPLDFSAIRKARELGRNQLIVSSTWASALSGIDDRGCAVSIADPEVFL